jgi:hypothetical protein
MPPLFDRASSNSLWLTFYTTQGMSAPGSMSTESTSEDASGHFVPRNQDLGVCGLFPSDVAALTYQSSCVSLQVALTATLDYAEILLNEDRHGAKLDRGFLRG